MNVTRIDDAEDPRVAPYMNLKDAWLRVKRGDTPREEELGLFIAEGTLVLRQLARSRHETESVLVLEERLDALRELLAEFPPGTPVYTAPRAVVEQIVGFDLHRGVLAAGRRGTQPELDELLRDARAAVVLEDLANHDNVGGIFRSVAALGGRSSPVVLSPRCCDPLYRKAIRVSMGQSLHVPWARADDLDTALKTIRGAGFTLVGLAPDPDAEPIDRVRVERPALLLGAEGPGLSEMVLSQVDVRVSIPIDPRADSLNVGVAAAIALHRLVSPELPLDSGNKIDEARVRSGDTIGPGGPCTSEGDLG